SRQPSFSTSYSFCHCFSYIRTLHSFPTRRSSDLNIIVVTLLILLIFSFCFAENYSQQWILKSSFVNLANNLHKDFSALSLIPIHAQIQSFLATLSVLPLLHVLI